MNNSSSSSTSNSVTDNIPSMDNEDNFFPIYIDDNALLPCSSVHNNANNYPMFPCISLSILLDVMLQTTWNKNHTESFPQATGTVESIHLWAKKAFPHDSEQQRAFEILAAKFVLGYCLDAEKFDENHDELSRKQTWQYLHCKNLLRQMVGKPVESKQLVMLVTGQAGSGKTEIIHQLLQYAEQYCSKIGQPFTTKTILVTACSALTAPLKMHIPYILQCF